MKFFSVMTMFLMVQVLGFGQGHVIHLKNPSFESFPAQGTDKPFFLPGWGDCAPYYFRNETPPDIHSINSDFFGVHKSAIDGNTFVGMVTRGGNETWEMISQRLSSALLPDKCYEFKIMLARAEKYLSKERRDTSHFYNFNKPVKLRIWGGVSACRKTQLLAESDPVVNTDWKEYTFRFKPKELYTYILFEVFYKTPVLIPYNGNILMDNASDIVEIPCPNDDLLASVDIALPPARVNKELPKTRKALVTKPVKNRPKKENTAIVSRPKTPEKTIVTNTHKNKPKILKKLDKNSISIGQTIKINNLYFEADSANLKEDSYEVLDEIYDFLKENPNVIIEIGGHTNGLPSSDFCNRLSTARAKTVADYLRAKGIPKYRIKYKGYGKSKPLYTNKTPFGRRKNQRVEIKILRVD